MPVQASPGKEGADGKEPPRRAQVTGRVGFGNSSLDIASLRWEGWKRREAPGFI